MRVTLFLFMKCDLFHTTLRLSTGHIDNGNVHVVMMDHIMTALASLFPIKIKILNLSHSFLTK